MKRLLAALLIGAALYAIADQLARLHFADEDLAWRVKILEGLR